MREIRIAALSDIGRVRTNNEDNFLTEYLRGGRVLLSVVIDGVGGYEGGEVAAALAADSISEYMKKAPLLEPLEELKQAVTYASNKIYEARMANARLSEMSCVLSAVLIDLDKDLLYLVHIGDTRLYEYRSGNLSKLSHDHSLVGYWEENGTITEEEAMAHPRRNVINRSLGDVIHRKEDEDFLDAGIFPVESGASYLFCSDGLYDMVMSTSITKVLGSAVDPESKVRQLIDMANAAGGKDNVTVILLETVFDPGADRPVTVATPAPPEIKEAGIPVAPSAPRRKGRGWIATLGIILAFAAGAAAGLFAPKYVKCLAPAEPTPIHDTVTVQICDSLCAEKAMCLKDSLDKCCHPQDSLKITEAEVNSTEPE